MDLAALRVYYARLFPFKYMAQWLSYGSDDTLSRREMSLTLQDGKDEIYVRYNSVSNATAFKEFVVKETPIKLDFGAVYNNSPAEHKKHTNTVFQPLEKELTFDIDMNDYDAVRSCCTGTNVCRKCWGFMTVAVKVLRSVLQDAFGFEHVLFVFSGRRGVHCWVCDPRARQLSSEARAAIVSFLTALGGGEGNRKVVLSRRLHPTFQRLYDDLLKPAFEKHILEEQQVLATSEKWAQVLAFIPNEELRERLAAEWNDHPQKSAAYRWQQFQNAIADDMRREEREQKSKKKFYRERDPVQEVVFYWTYPRLDANVSNRIDHLLKSPFCVHPKTGKVCIPIDPDKVDDFDPATVPVFTDLLEEINQYQGSDDGIAPMDIDESGVVVKETTKRLSDYKKTRLREAITLFKTKFLRPLQADTRKQGIAKAIARSSGERPAVAADW